MAADHSHASEKFHVSKTSNEEEEHNSHASQKFPLSKTNNEDVYEQTFQKYEQMLETLPKERGWHVNVGHVYRYQGFWFGRTFSLKGILLLQNHFKARPSDIFVASQPKCGSTWLRALAFAVVNRTTYRDFSDHPLLRFNPRDLAPFLDAFICQNSALTKLQVLPEPRLLSTHFPYKLFSQSAKTLSGCKFLYICRNPKDTFVSAWHFFNKLRSKELPPISLQEGFELFCEGTVEYGPFWDHVLDYWKASLEFPDKVLFFKFEDLKRDPSVHIKRLADFFERPFSPEEEREGVAREIIKLCSFENMSNLEVNKKVGQPIATEIGVKNSDFFRKGQVGDWVNYLTEEMAERLDRITEEKLRGSGLSFVSSL